MATSQAAAASTTFTVLTALSVTEKLLVAQAVYATGNSDYRGVSKLLQDHALLKHKQRGEFTPERCQKVFVAQMEDMGLDTTATLPANSPVLLKVAKKYYLERVVELREAMQREQDQFKIVFAEIQHIKDGKMDLDFLREKKALEAATTGGVGRAQPKKRGRKTSTNVKQEDGDTIMAEA